MRWRKVEPSSSLRRFEAIAFLPRRQTLHRSRCWMVTWVWRHVANMQARRVSSSSNKLFEHITSTICNWQRFIWINTELNVDDKWRRPTDPAECVIHSRAAFECALADFVARFFLIWSAIIKCDSSMNWLMFTSSLISLCASSNSFFVCSNVISIFHQV